MEKDIFKQGIVRVNDDYLIVVDSMDYTLCKDRHKTDKEGKPVYKTLGYYTSLESALNALGKEFIKERLEGAEMGLKEAVSTIREANRELSDIIRKCMEEGLVK